MFYVHRKYSKIQIMNIFVTTTILRNLILWNNQFRTNLIILYEHSEESADIIIKCHNLYIYI